MKKWRPLYAANAGGGGGGETGTTAAGQGGASPEGTAQPTLEGLLAGAEQEFCAYCRRDDVPAPMYTCSGSRTTTVFATAPYNHSSRRRECARSSEAEAGPARRIAAASGGTP